MPYGTNVSQTVQPQGTNPYAGITDWAGVDFSGMTFNQIMDARLQIEKNRRKAAGMQNWDYLSPEWIESVKSEVAATTSAEFGKQLLDPNSSYYQKINKQIANQLAGTVNPNSLLALTAAAGGSPIQAAQEARAMEGRLSDTAGQLANQYYLNAASQAPTFLNQYIQNAQYQQGLAMQDRFNQQARKDSFISDLVGAGGQILGAVAGSFGGGAPSGKVSGGANTGTNYPQMSSSYNMTGGKGFFGLYTNRYGNYNPYGG